MRAGETEPNFFRRGGLTLRVLMASTLLALLIGAVLAFLIRSIDSMAGTAALARHSEKVMDVGDDLERLVVDLESGQRGFLVSGDEAFLRPWKAARANFEPQADTFYRLSKVHSAVQGKRAAKIINEGMSYIRDYSDPVVQATRNEPNAKPDPAVLIEGRLRMEQLRADFDDFTDHEQSLAWQREQRALRATHQTMAVAVGGMATTVLLIGGFAYYVHRGVVRPVRRTSRMVGQVARGDLSVRIPETSAAEVGALERSFNSMAGSLEKYSAELIASRTRIVAAGDATRRRIERDLHDGTQQRLVTVGLELRMAEADVPDDQQALRKRLSWLVNEVTDVIRELREISRGIHPAILTKGGLVPALTTLGRRSAVPVDFRLKVDRKLGEPVEVAVYYLVSEALTNVAKHAHASLICVEVDTGAHDVNVKIRDNGVGGADPARGSGLVGLCDRVEALGGTMEVKSPVNDGTTLWVKIPVDSR